MKNIILPLFCLSLFSVSCKKLNTDPVPDTPVAKKQGYITVQCDVCKVDYGMPDQYKGLNINGNSGKLYFDFADEYYLKTYITALNHEQKVSLTVYDSNNKIVYTDAVTQPTTGFWETYVLVRKDSSN